MNLSPATCKAWGDKFKAKYSATRYNGCLQTFNAVLRLAIKGGLLAANPLAEITPASIKRRPKQLPTDAKFALLLHYLRAHPRREAALLVVQFLAFTGRRIGHAQLLRPGDVDMSRQLITWAPFKHDDKPQIVPMIKQLVPVVKKLLRIHPGGDAPLLPIKNPRRALKTCCKLAGIPAMNNHDMRHLMTTKALESGIPVPDVALLRGDLDGGKMLLTTYSHPRLDHLRSVVKRLRV